MALPSNVAVVTSAALRICSILFFRFARLPSFIFTLFAFYVPSFFLDLSAKTRYVVTKSQPQSSNQETLPLRSSEDPELLPAKLTEVVNVESKTKDSSETPFGVLTCGLPSPQWPKLSLVTFLVNLVLVILTVDALYRARWFYQAEDLSLVRLGYVSPTEAKFLIREPDQSQMPLSFEIRSLASPNESSHSPWRKIAEIHSTSEKTDFTQDISVSLKYFDQQHYEWRTSNAHSGAFFSPPKPGLMPRINEGKFTFLSTSCILARFPYNPLDHALTISGLRHLANKLPELKAQFMLFLGDFIYVDVPERFGTSADEYRMQYRQVYASPEWKLAAQNLSWIHVLDDHEISNDWSSNTTGLYQAAIEPWHIYQANSNPPAALAAGSRNQRRTGATWYEFVQGPASFFMLDTRSYRSSNNEPFDNVNKTMLGEPQLADFLAWLARPESPGVKWKFVASSVPFTKNFPVNGKDTWAGFLVERKKILSAMWDAGSQGTTVVVLSGDRHEFAATKFPPPSGGRWPETATAFEFSTSPLNQFASPFPTYKQTDNEDVKLKYIPSGSSKFGSFTIDNREGKSTLLYRLFIDGQETWNTVLSEVPQAKDNTPRRSFWDAFRLK